MAAMKLPSSMPHAQLFHGAFQFRGRLFGSCHGSGSLIFGATAPISHVARFGGLCSLGSSGDAGIYGMFFQTNNLHKLLLSLMGLTLGVGEVVRFEPTQGPKMSDAVSPKQIGPPHFRPQFTTPAATSLPLL